MEILRLVLTILLVVSSVILVIFVLMHKGTGGGLSDMFGGGISSGAGSSGVAERNLNRLTIITAVVWGVIVILLAIVERFYPTIG